MFASLYSFYDGSFYFLLIKHLTERNGEKLNEGVGLEQYVEEEDAAIIKKSKRENEKDEEKRIKNKKIRKDKE